MQSMVMWPSSTTATSHKTTIHDLPTTLPKKEKITMNLEPVVSSLISHRGYDPEKQVLHIRFASKTHTNGALYEYGNVAPELFAEGLAHKHSKTGELSFGQWFQQIVKAQDKRFPYRKLEDPHNGDGFVGTTLDFESGAPVPAVVPQAVEGAFAESERIKEARIALDAWRSSDQTDKDNRHNTEDAEAELNAAIEEALKAKAEELTAKALAIGPLNGNLIVISSPEAYELAALTGMAIARMRAALETTLRPNIDKAHKVWKAGLAVLNNYDKPLAADQDRLRAGMLEFKRAERKKELEEEARLNREQELAAEQLAKEQSVELQLHDAINAESRGEPEIAEIILNSAPMPMSAAFAAPIRVASVVPKVEGTTTKENWQWVAKDESKIPDEYWILDTKAIDKVVKALKDKANITFGGGIHAYDAGTVSFSKRA